MRRINNSMCIIGRAVRCKYIYNCTRMIIHGETICTKSIFNIEYIFFNSFNWKYLAKVDSGYESVEFSIDGKKGGSMFGAPAGDHFIRDLENNAMWIRQIERGRDTQSATPRYATRMRRKQEERTPVPRLPLSTLRVRFGQRARYVNVTSLRNVIPIELVD